MQPADLLDDHLTVLGPRARAALTATAVRTRSLDARLLQARAALGDTGTLDELIAAARAGDRRWLRHRRRRLDPGAVAALAQTIALQDVQPGDRRDALALYDLVRAACGPRALSPAHQGLHAQLTLAWEGADRMPGLLAAYRGIRPDVRAALDVDLRNPFVVARPVEPWLAAFGALLPGPPPTLDGDADLPPFDRLTAPPGTPVEAPQRVSVVITASRPGPGLLTTVRSIAAQTWRNVEMIVVDDASPAGYDDVFARAVALGDRIRLVRQRVAGGPYAARNAGTAAAGGEFVAFQDAGEWSHPRRLELQVAPLLADRGAVATTSDALGVTEELLVGRAGARCLPSSVLFRRAVVLGRAGWFEPVREAGDAEYLGRIRAAFGAGAVRHVGAGPLALVRGFPVDTPARAAYRSAYVHRHRTGGRPLSAPARDYDVVVAADWRFQEGAQRSAVAELRALAGAGLRVAVVHLESYRAVHARRHPLAGPVQELINDGVVGRVLLSDDCRPALLIVRQAAVLQFTAGRTSGIRPGRTVIVADRAPHRGDGIDRRYVPAMCSAHARELFGAEPVWCPQDAGVRRALGDCPVTDADLPTVAGPRQWCAPRPGATPGRPVIGVDLCDAGTWPADLPDAVAVLRRLPSVDARVRLPDGLASPPALPGAWLTYTAGDIAARTFLHQLDFYVHYPHPRAAEVLSRPALEAAAVGCVVVLPERCAGLFGDAAVYAPPEGVAEVVRRYAGDAGAFTEQSRRAREVVARAHGGTAFVEFVAALTPAAAPA
jgi:glycosyltransferase involved in cell wall biosynthesis